MNRFVRPAYAPAITRRRNREHWGERQSGFEESFRRNFQSWNRICVAFKKHGRLDRDWKKRAHDKPLRVYPSRDVWSEQVERVGVLRSRQKLHFAHWLLWGDGRDVRRCFCSAQMSLFMNV